MQDEHVLTADIFEDLDENFAIVKSLDPCIDQTDVHPPVHGQASSDGFAEGRERVPGDDFRFLMICHGQPWS